MTKLINKLVELGGVFNACSASPKNDNFDEWIGTIIGPEDTVYAGGVFFLDISFPDEYPFKPVKV